MYQVCCRLPALAQILFCFVILVCFARCLADMRLRFALISAITKDFTK
jgi:hypothetical protein